MSEHFPWVCFPVFTWTAYTILTVCCLPFDPACRLISSLSAACPDLCIAPVADSALPSLHLLLSLNLACLTSSCLPIKLHLDLTTLPLYYRYNPPYSPRTVLIQSEQNGWQNHSGPLTSSTLPLWTVTIWSTLQSPEHQNDQTQKQFLPPSNRSHEHLTLNMEHTTLLNKYLFTIHTFFILQICTSDLTHNYLYCILNFYHFVHYLFVHLYIVLLLYVSCPVAVIVLHFGASVTITNSSYV